MSEKLPDRWVARDFPVLVEVTRRIDDGDDTIPVAEVAEATGLSDREVGQAANALKRRGLVTLVGTAEVDAIWFVGVSGEAYLLTGLHPSGDDAVSNLIEALRQAADQVSDPEEKSRLRKLADAAGGVGRDVLAGVLTAVITATTGIAR